MLVEVFFVRKHVSEEDQRYFTKLMAHFREASARRNEIAHGIAIGMTVNERQLGFVLVPPEYNSRKTSPFVKASDTGFDILRADYRYTAADAHHFRLRIRDLINHDLKDRG